MLLLSSYREILHMRMQSLFLIFILSLGLFSMNAQEVSGKILAADSGNPIAYATIQYGKNKGVISNGEGFFSIHSEASIDSLIIASLGYQTVYIKDFGKDMDILLEPEATELQEVYLSDEQLSGEEIMERVVANIKNNYDFGVSERKFFYRESNNQIIGLDLDVKKSSIDEIDQELMDGITANIPEEIGSYVEVAGSLYGDYDEQKLRIEKAANLFNAPANENLEELADELENILRENVKEDSFLKIRSGLIGVKIDSDQLSEGLKDADLKEAPSPEEKEKREFERRERFQATTQENVSALFDKMFWKEDLTMDFFEKSRRYDFSLEGFASLEGQGVYVIAVAPKRRSDFRGKIFVNVEDYGVHRLEFENVKTLSSFKLFGISKTADLYSGKMFFSRSAEGKYAPAYLEHQSGSTMGVDRPLKIIERNRVVPGRNKQNQLKMNVDMGMRDITTYQFYVFDTQPFDEADYNALLPSMDFKFETFEQYNSEYWKGTTIIEPNTAIRDYTTMQP